jgi:hypothetical protein
MTLFFSRGGRPPKTGSAARPVSDQIPDADFEELLRTLRAAGEGPSAPGLIRTWFQGRGRRRPASLEHMAEELRKAGWIVIPPPPR